ncbi:restriction endonuclease subunit S [Citrobacter braakii]|nr:restriction endonuclease subunit S [Citrobacter braakii]
MNNQNKLHGENVIPAGYKRTEVGVIPNDWDEINLNSIVSGLEAGVSVNSIDQVDAYSHGKHILKTSCVSNGHFDGYEKKSILPTDVKRAKCSPVKGGIIVSRMNTPALVGEVGYVAESNLDSFLPDRLWQMKFKKDVARNPKWLATLLSFPPFSKKIKDTATGTSGSMKNISKSAFLSLKLPWPTLKEQNIIGTVLSDADALITALEQLIAKKQAIKTATMQQLLTGRTRLPQYAKHPDGTIKSYKHTELGLIPVDWIISTIDECANKVGSGKTPSGGSSVYTEAGHPFVRSQNIGWGKLELSDVAYISDAIHKTFPSTELAENDVLLNITGASIGRCALSDFRIAGGNVNQHVCIIRVNSDKLIPKLLVELMNADIGQNQIDSFQAGGNREGLNFSQVRQLRFAIPISLEEQNTIATILSDMDTELVALEQRLAKVRDIKQGMMQQLLTGRIRLPLEQQP